MTAKTATTTSTPPAHRTNELIHWLHIWKGHPCCATAIRGSSRNWCYSCGRHSYVTLLCPTIQSIAAIQTEAGSQADATLPQLVLLLAAQKASGVMVMALMVDTHIQIDTLFCCCCCLAKELSEGKGHLDHHYLLNNVFVFVLNAMCIWSSCQTVFSKLMNVFECVDVYEVDGKDRGKGKRSKSTNTHSTALYWWMKMLNEWRQSEEKAPHTSMHICRLLTAHFACRCQCQKWLKWAKLNELSHWLDSLSAVCRRLRQRISLRERHQQTKSQQLHSEASEKEKKSQVQVWSLTSHCSYLSTF